MSGVEKIIARLNEETEAQCREILFNAKKKAAAIVQRAQAEGNETIRLAEDAAKKQSEGILAAAASQDTAAARRARLGARVALVNEVLARAQRNLHDLSDEAYFNALAGMALKNRQEGIAEMQLSERDLKRMPNDFIDKLGYGFKVSPVPAAIDDGFILKYGDIEINCTFAALFRAFEPELQAKANALLFGAPGEGK